MGADIENRLLAQANCASPPEDELLREAAAVIGRLRGAISAAIGDVSQPSVALDFIAERLHDSNNFPVDSDEVRSAVGAIDSAMNTLRKVLGTANE